MRNWREGCIPAKTKTFHNLHYIRLSFPCNSRVSTYHGQLLPHYLIPVLIAVKNTYYDFLEYVPWKVWFTFNYHLFLFTKIMIKAVMGRGGGGWRNHRDCSFPSSSCSYYATSSFPSSPSISLHTSHSPSSSCSSTFNICFSFSGKFPPERISHSVYRHIVSVLWQDLAHQLDPNSGFPVNPGTQIDFSGDEDDDTWLYVLCVPFNTG